MPLATLLVVACFAAVHLFAGKLRFIRMIPRSRWLSAAGGVAVAYVFLHILPELEASQRHLAGVVPRAGAFLEHHVYLIALLGLVVFYGLERLVGSSRRQGTPPPPAIFWLHMGAFAAYNALIGYLTLHREEQSAAGLVFYFVAIGLHFLTNDFGLRYDHAGRYDRSGRFILAGAVLAGWLAGLAFDLSRPALAVPFAFLAGGIVLNVLKEELPEERESRFGAFALGVGGYGALLLMA